MALNNLAQKASSAVNDKLGSILGIGSGDIPLYNKFVSAILQDADNTIPEKSHWVAFFSFPQPPETKTEEGGSLLKRLEKKVSDFKYSDLESAIFDTKKIPKNFAFGGIINNMTNSATPLDTRSWSLGDKANKMANFFTEGAGKSVMLLAGIEVPGDGFQIERPSRSFNVGGYLKSPITKPRNELKELEVVFLENNSSLVDFVIRPWMISSSYVSLKFAKTAVLTVFNLTRSPTGFRVRKEFNFYNVVPISIDAEKYTYDSSTDFGKRQINFVFTDYIVREGQGLQDSLFAGFANMVKRTALKAITGVVEGGVDLVAGGASQVITNVTGAFTNAVRDVIVDTQARVREFADNAEDSLITKGTSAATKLVPTVSPIVTNPPNAVILKTDQSDHIDPTPLPIKDTTTKNSVTYTVINTPMDDVIQKAGNEIKDSTTRNSVQYTILSVKKDDTVDASSINYSEVSINSDDSNPSSGLKFTPVAISNNEGVYSPEIIDVPQNDNIRS